MHPRFALLALVLAAAPGSCAHTAPGAGACTPWKSLTWSRRDTPLTIDGVKGNNARRAAFCA